MKIIVTKHTDGDITYLANITQWLVNKLKYENNVNIAFLNENIKESNQYISTLKNIIKKESIRFKYRYKHSFILDNNNRFICGSHKGHNVLRGSSPNLIILNNFNTVSEKIQNDLLCCNAPVWSCRKNVTLIITLNEAYLISETINKIIENNGLYII